MKSSLTRLLLIPSRNVSSGDLSSRDLSSRVHLSVFVFIFTATLSHIHQGTLGIDAIRYASIATSLLHDGNLFSLYDPFLQAPYPNKAPFLFWLAALSIHTFGATTFAARLPAALFSALALWLLWRFCRRHFGENAALCSVLLFGAMPAFYRYGVELSFEGVLLSGLILIFDELASPLVVSAEDSQTHDGEKAPPLLSWKLILGVFLVCQAKPPVLFLTLLPGMLFSLYFSERARRHLLAWLPSLFIGLSVGNLWYFLQDPSIQAQTVTNQILVPVVTRPPIAEQVFEWSKSFFGFLLPLSLFLIPLWRSAPHLPAQTQAAAFKRFKLFARTITIGMLPVIIFIRPEHRYLLPFLVPTAVYAGALTADNLRATILNGLPTGIIVLSGGLIISIACGLTLHRTDPTIPALQTASAEELSSLAAICLDTKPACAPYHDCSYGFGAGRTNKPLLRRTELLTSFYVHSEHLPNPPRAVSSEVLPALPLEKGATLLLNELCEKRIAEKFQLTVLRRIPEGAKPSRQVALVEVSATHHPVSGSADILSDFERWSPELH